MHVVTGPRGHSVGELADLPREVGRNVDHGIPQRGVDQRGVVGTVPIAVAVRDRPGEQIVVRSTTVEHGDVVAGSHRAFNGMAADE